MKVKISITEEVSDEQRLAIAKALHGPNAKKDHATREDLKDFLWRGGRDWALLLQRAGELAVDGLDKQLDAGVEVSGEVGDSPTVVPLSDPEPEIPGMELI